MIRVHVAQFLKDDPGSRREVEFRETGPRLGDVQLAEPLEGSAELVRTQRGILVTMPYDATMTLICGRCLGEFSYHVEDRFQDEVLAPAGEFHERDSNRDDDALRVGADYMLDLGEILRQELVMQTPLQPICRDDCPGLCETCGVDLRTERCSCDQIGSDSPFAALRQLLPDQMMSPPESGR
jgi:DUF177 domain-containing protein